MNFECQFFDNGHIARTKGFFLGDIYKLNYVLPAGTELNLELFKSSGVALSKILNQIYGEFSFAFFNEKMSHVIFGRDALGIMPLYIAQDINKRWVMSTRMHEIIKNISEIRVNHKYLSAINKGDFSLQTETAFENVWRCPPGHWGRIENNQFIFESYWQIKDFDKKEQFVNYNECIDRGSRIFNEVISERINTNKKIDTLLSGGLDSSMIAKQLSRAAFLTDRLNYLSTQTLRFTHPPEEDAPGINEVLKSLDCRAHQIDFAKLSNEVWNYNIIQDPAIIFYDPTLWLYKPLLKAAHERGVELIITGLGGDDVFHPAQDIIMDLSLSESIKALANLNLFEKRKNILYWLKTWLVKPLFLKARKFISYFNKKSVLYRYYQLQSPCSRALAHRFHFGGGFTFAIEQEQELAQMWGLRMSYPLLDRRFIDFATQIPAEFHLRTDANKPILREIAKRILPESLAWRRSLQNYNKVREGILLRQKSRGLFFKSFEEGDEQSIFDQELCARYTFMCQNIKEFKEQNVKRQEKNQVEVREART